jgi:hypothetical protein
MQEPSSHHTAKPPIRDLGCRSARALLCIGTLLMPLVCTSAQATTADGAADSAPFSFLSQAASFVSGANAGAMPYGENSLPDEAAVRAAPFPAAASELPLARATNSAAASPCNRGFIVPAPGDAVCGNAADWFALDVRFPDQPLWADATVDETLPVTGTVLSTPASMGLVLLALLALAFMPTSRWRLTQAAVRVAVRAAG